VKIYTKTGDKGQTSLLTGKRVAKSHPRIEAYGTIDELNSFVGLLGAYEICQTDKLVLEKIQYNLFNIGALLAMEIKKPEFKIKDISDADISLLEIEMDKMTEILPKLKSFIIPGGSQSVATAHVCRSICRRAERICIHLSEHDLVDSTIIVYLNRLSDYFFMLARKIAFENKIEIPTWPER
jgi:cob(I)alamin adenosyltransferase